MSDRDLKVGNERNIKRETPDCAVGHAYAKGSVGGLDEGLR